MDRTDHMATKHSNGETTMAQKNGLNKSKLMTGASAAAGKPQREAERRSERGKRRTKGSADMATDVADGGVGESEAVELTGRETSLSAMVTAADGGRRGRKNGAPTAGERESGALGVSARERERSDGSQRERERESGAPTVSERERERESGALGVKAAAEQTNFEKELTVALEIQGEGEISALELMRCIRELCGGLIACRAIGSGTYEVTMSHIKGKERLMDGFKIGDNRILAKELCNDELVVSFLNLPAYITDVEILNKLEGWGVSAASLIRRRMWPGTKIADGTRFLKVRFNERVQSLPYSTKFDTAIGPEYFRVIHDRQARVCRMCLQPGHILRECPEFSCHKCGVQGHYARECIKKKPDKRCEVCYNLMNQCTCNYSEEETAADSVEELSEESAESEEEMEKEVEEEEERLEAGNRAAEPARLSAAPSTRSSSRLVSSGVSAIGSSLDGVSSAQLRCVGESGEGLGFGTSPEPGSAVIAASDSNLTLEPRPDTAESAPPLRETQPHPSARISGDSGSDMDIAAVKLIRKQHTSEKNRTTKRRKKTKT